MNSEHNSAHEMRRKDRLLTQAEALGILEQGTYGVLSTVGEDGYPYGIPMNYVYKDGRIYLHCAAKVGHKVENIRYCQKVCFTVVGSSRVIPEAFTTKYQSAVVFGVTAEVTGQKRQVLDMLVERFSPEYREAGRTMTDAVWEKTGVYEIIIESVSGKSNRE